MLSRPDNENLTQRKFPATQYFITGVFCSQVIEIVLKSFPEKALLRMGVLLTDSQLLCTIIQLSLDS